jgi:uracil-DNA glycosylase
MFGRELVERCVGTNAIFIRADSIDDYKSIVCKSNEVLPKIKEFCRNCVEKMVDAIEPRLIVAIGFETLYLFGGSGGSNIDKKSEKNGRVLTRTGKIFGRDALGVLHLSGARISNQDRETIANRIRSSII